MYYNASTLAVDVCTCSGVGCPATGAYAWGSAAGTGTAALNGITKATATNTIDSTSFGSQVWDWSGLVSGTALTLADTDASATTATTLAVNNAATGTGYGVAATISGASNTGYAVYGINSGATNTGAGGYFTNSGGGYALITGSGNVGIGTTTPGANLEIAASSTTGPTININNTNAGIVAGNTLGKLNFISNTSFITGPAASIGALATDNGADYAITFSTNAHSSGTLTEDMRILDSGSVVLNGVQAEGGGTERLEIQDVSGPSGNPELNFVAANAPFGSPAGTISFLNYNGGGPWERGRIELDMPPAGGNNASGDLVFYTAASTTGVGERMRINYLGNVGIGTARPTNLLSVGAYGNVGQTTAYIQARNAGNSVEWGHGNPAGYASTLGAQAGSGQAFLCFSCEAGTTNNTFKTRGLKGSLFEGDNAGGFLFATVPTASADNQTATNLMSILTSGNVGIGTTSPGATLDVSNSSASGAQMYIDSMAGNATGNYSMLAFRSVDPASNIDPYAAIAGVVDSTGHYNGDIGFYNRTDLANAVNNRTMIIKYNGNVGIGTTSPGALLDVSKSLQVVQNASANYWPQIIGGVDGTSDAVIGLSGGSSNNGNLDIKGRGGAGSINFCRRHQWQRRYNQCHDR
ncbi:MAG TPA: hypothetical protein VHW66_22315 [Stellaceae bacterium]|nr:hypothetical protein [Stellaceae bacterium]